MAIAIKPRGIARGQMHASRRYLNSLLQRNANTLHRTGKVLFNTAEATTLAAAVTTLNEALGRKGDVELPAPP